MVDACDDDGIALRRVRGERYLSHARAMAGRGVTRPFEVDLRRGVSSAYYAVFHELSLRTIRQLVPSAEGELSNRLRRSFRHADFETSARWVARRRPEIRHEAAPVRKADGRSWQLILDLAAEDERIARSAELLLGLKTSREQADYDFNVRFDKATLLSKCDDAEECLALLDGATASGREAYLALTGLRLDSLSERAVVT